jgi:hypothetical protein
LVVAVVMAFSFSAELGARGYTRLMALSLRVWDTLATQ